MANGSLLGNEHEPEQSSDASLVEHLHHSTTLGLGRRRSRGLSPGLANHLTSAGESDWGCVMLRGLVALGYHAYFSSHLRRKLVHEVLTLFHQDLLAKLWRECK